MNGLNWFTLSVSQRFLRNKDWLNLKRSCLFNEISKLPTPSVMVDSESDIEVVIQWHECCSDWQHWFDPVSAWPRPIGIYTAPRYSSPSNTQSADRRWVGFSCNNFFVFYLYSEKKKIIKVPVTIQVLCRSMSVYNNVRKVGFCLISGLLNFTIWPCSSRQSLPFWF